MAPARLKQAPAIGEVPNGALVTMSVSKIMKMGDSYSNAVKILRLRYGANVAKQSVEATIMGACGKGDYICCFVHGRVHQQIVVPGSCFTKVELLGDRHRVAPSVHNGKPSRFSLAAAERAASRVTPTS